VQPVRSRHVIVAGAGIAGLTAAIAFARHGFSVEVLERRSSHSESGAGLQLSPNATRILDRLGVMPQLRAFAVQPSAVVLRRADDLRRLAAIPLGSASEQRWGAPYLTLHRADLQAALLAAARSEPELRIETGAAVVDFAAHRQGVTVSVHAGNTIREARGLLLVGADGVWSTLRNLAGRHGPSRFTGTLAWRLTVPATPETLEEIAPSLSVNAFLSAGFHLVAYPIRAGTALNLVAFTRGEDTDPEWSAKADPAALRAHLQASAPALAAFAGLDWRAHPVHTVDAQAGWLAGSSVALVGDAAHAMTPYAAQGAAMAIEDAASLAETVATSPDELDEPLIAWERQRRSRVAQVRRRGAFNRFVWHAAGPVAMARDLALRLRPPSRLASDLDWLYGHDALGGVRTG
jgi:salicylate hydroxylase